MNRPFVFINIAATADGKTTSATREYPRFTSAQDRLHMDRLRASADAILVGGRTLRADNPALHVRSVEMRDHRASLGKADGLLRVVVTASLRIDDDSRFFDERGRAGRIIATVEDAPEDRLAALASRAEIWKIGRGRVDLSVLLERLFAERGVRRLLCEGGGELNWALLRQGLIDELNLTIAPVLLGGRDAPTPLDGEGLSMEQRARLRLEQVRREGDELFCRYSVVR